DPSKVWLVDPGARPRGLTAEGAVAYLLTPVRSDRCSTALGSITFQRDTDAHPEAIRAATAPSLDRAGGTLARQRYAALALPSPGSGPQRRKVARHRARPAK